MDRELITVREGARELKIGRSTMSKYCLLLGFKKTGRDYILTREQLAQVEDEIYREGKRLPCSAYEESAS